MLVRIWLVNALSISKYKIWQHGQFSHICIQYNYQTFYACMCVYLWVGEHECSHNPQGLLTTHCLAKHGCLNDDSLAVLVNYCSICPSTNKSIEHLPKHCLTEALQLSFTSVGLDNI